MTGSFQQADQVGEHQYFLTLVQVLEVCIGVLRVHNSKGDNLTHVAHKRREVCGLQSLHVSPGIPEHGSQTLLERITRQFLGSL